ncbi:MAG: hypothetical protein ACI86H_002805, partial [bacterium]
LVYWGVKANTQKLEFPQQVNFKKNKPILFIGLFYKT